MAIPPDNQNEDPAAGGDPSSQPFPPGGDGSSPSNPLLAPARVLNWSRDPQLITAADALNDQTNPTGNLRPPADEIYQLLVRRLQWNENSSNELLNNLAQIFESMQFTNSQLEQVNLLQVLNVVKATSLSDTQALEINGVRIEAGARQKALQSYDRYRSAVISTIQDQLAQEGKDNSVTIAEQVLASYEEKLGATPNVLGVDLQAYLANDTHTTQTTVNPDGTTSTVDVTPDKISQDGDSYEIDFSKIVSDTQTETPYKLQDINRYVIEENVNQWGQQWLGRNLTTVEVTALIDTMDKHRKQMQRTWNPADHNQIQFGQMIDPNTNLDNAATAEYLGTTFEKERRSIANAETLDTLKRRIT